VDGLKADTRFGITNENATFLNTESLSNNNFKTVLILPTYLKHKPFSIFFYEHIEEINRINEQ